MTSIFIVDIVDFGVCAATALSQAIEKTLDRASLVALLAPEPPVELPIPGWLRAVTYASMVIILGLGLGLPAPKASLEKQRAGVVFTAPNGRASASVRAL